MHPFLSLGFRPFFLLGTAYAFVLMLVWVPWFLGLAGPTSAYPPATWHAHELLFGFVPAVIAGFLLTAVPNWTSRRPLTGWPLLALVGVWFCGRIAIAFAHIIGEGSAALLSLVFPVTLTIMIGRELLAARSLRNLKVWLVLAALTAAQATFHLEILDTGQPQLGERFGVASILGLVLIISNRVTPTFTRNWLRQNAPGTVLPEWGLVDRAASTLAGFALVGWAALPLFERSVGGDIAMVIAALCGAAGLATLCQQSRWQPLRTVREPLVLILHVAYMFVGIGFLLQGTGIALDDFGLMTAALHCWTVGGVGTMSLAIMTRATRGHTGRSLTAHWGTSLVYALIIIAAIARMASAVMPQQTMLLLPVAGLSWMLAFSGFFCLYFAALIRPRQELTANPGLRST